MLADSSYPRKLATARCSTNVASPSAQEPTHQRRVARGLGGEVIDSLWKAIVGVEVFEEPELNPYPNKLGDDGIQQEAFSYLPLPKCPPHLLSRRLDVVE